MAGALRCCGASRAAKESACSTSSNSTGHDFVRDVLLGFVLIPVSLVFIFAGTFAAGWIVSATASADSSRIGARLDGWCDRADSGIEHMTEQLLAIAIRHQEDS